MPRRRRPWAVHPVSAVAVLTITAAVAVLPHCSLAFVVQQPISAPSTLSTPCHYSRVRSLLLADMETTVNSCSVTGSSSGNKKAAAPSASLWRMVAQEVESVDQSRGGVIRPPPFATRKLGSFEKMLTQTRDGVGPAEDGVRTLLTPHVWVSKSTLEN